VLVIIEAPNVILEELVADNIDDSENAAKDIEVLLLMAAVG
jgi:hypothetical protein